jgi:hypothetical protein
MLLSTMSVIIFIEFPVLYFLSSLYILSRYYTQRKIVEKKKINYINVHTQFTQFTQTTLSLLLQYYIRIFILMQQISVFKSFIELLTN